MSTFGIFVCGSPYSEVSLVSWGLNQHDALSSGPESRFLYQIFGQSAGLTEPYLYHIYKQVAEPGTWLASKGVSYPLFAKYIGMGIAEMFTSLTNKTRWVESSPENALFIDELAYMFPDAVFLVMQESAEYVAQTVLYRDKKATSVDITKALDLSNHYRNCTNSIAERRADRVFIVPQDRLLTHTENMVDEIFDFIGETKSPDVLLFLERQMLMCGTKFSDYRLKKLPALPPQAENLIKVYKQD